MDSVLRALAIYLFLLLVIRISGKRTLADMTTFDFVLVLIIGEAVQNALLGEDFSLTNAVLVILTLVAADVGFSYLKEHFPRLDRIMDSVPVILVEEGQVLKERLGKARVDESDILAAARRLRGLARLEQIKYAVLERNGGITIIPKEECVKP